MTGTTPPDPDPETPTGSLAAVRRAKTRLREHLAGDDRVVGVGISGQEGAYRLEVRVGRAAPDAAPVTVPDEVAGVPVRVVTVGPIRAG